MIEVSSKNTIIYQKVEYLFQLQLNLSTYILSMYEDLTEAEIEK